MLTSRVGETIINCFDGKCDKYTLKKWSEKNKLFCPDCGKLYEYCHGEIKHPYFRHKDKSKDCDGIYSEPESEEHIEGKTILYNWLLKMQEENLIKELKLESYIASTKQRPDIYFEIQNERYVIEFQCTPIATEFLERRELYKLAGINDIWILGTDKYNIELKNNSVAHSKFYKTIENYCDLYLDVNTSRIYADKDLIRPLLPYNNICLDDYYVFDVSSLIINNEKKNIEIKRDVISHMIQEDIAKEREILHRKGFEKKLLSIIHESINRLNEYFKSNIDNTCNFHHRKGFGDYYVSAVEFSNKEIERTFFIKTNAIDYCTRYQKSVVIGRGKRGGPIWDKRTAYNQISTTEIDDLGDNTLISIITKLLINDIKSYKEITQHIQKQHLRKNDFKHILNKFLRSKIRFINSNKLKVPDHMKFKVLKGFEMTEEYMRNVFVKELNFLKKKNVDEYVYMIPKLNHSYRDPISDKYYSIGDYNNVIIKYFESFGFSNVKFLQESEDAY